MAAPLSADTDEDGLHSCTGTTAPTYSRELLLGLRVTRMTDAAVSPATADGEACKPSTAKTISWIGSGKESGGEATGLSAVTLGNTKSSPAAALKPEAPPSSSLGSSPLSGKARMLNASAPEFIPSQALGRKVPLPKPLDLDRSLELSPKGTPSTAPKQPPTPLSLADTIAEPPEAIAASAASPSPLAASSPYAQSPMGTWWTGASSSPSTAGVSSMFATWGSGTRRQLDLTDDAATSSSQLSAKATLAAALERAATDGKPSQTAQASSTRPRPSSGGTTAATGSVAEAMSCATPSGSGASSRFEYHLHRLLFLLVARKCREQTEARLPSEQAGIKVGDVQSEWTKVYGSDMLALMEKCGHSQVEPLVRDIDGLELAGSGSDLRVVATVLQPLENTQGAGDAAQPAREGDASFATAAESKQAPAAVASIAPVPPPSTPPPSPPEKAVRLAQAVDGDATPRKGGPKVLSLDQYVETGSPKVIGDGSWGRGGPMSYGNSPGGMFWGMTGCSPAGAWQGGGGYDSASAAWYAAAAAGAAAAVGAASPAGSPAGPSALL
eukprot:gnl/TRDRNA2_/TRDRNA2_48075_c0_seq1.p1 gnl/TRDRNA2_/TRDRNA2_48075_c0~~gnl/TRDRNA2_/TRDRNA2_48075_c0_seq1.p1  ORF type:complete len:562 (-),score=96.10 gnl/TRDRNA2_/TRDRNA2_48075_c0_seq1:132-1796(-)